MVTKRTTNMLIFKDKIVRVEDTNKGLVIVMTTGENIVIENVTLRMFLDFYNSSKDFIKFDFECWTYPNPIYRR